MMDLIPNFTPSLETATWGGGGGNGQVCHSLTGPGRRWNPYLGTPPTTGLLVVERPLVQGLLFCLPLLCRGGRGSFIMDHPPGPTSTPITTCRAWVWIYLMHSWLNWVDEEDWWWGWLERKAIKSKWDLNHRECGQTEHNGLYAQMYAIIGNCRLGNGPVHPSPGRRWNPYRTVGCAKPPVQGLVLFCLPSFMPGRHRIINNGPPSRPHQVTCYDMKGEGCILLPRSSTGSLLYRPLSRNRVYLCSFPGTRFIKCFRTIFLHTHHSLLAKQDRWRWGWGLLERKARRH